MKPKFNFGDKVTWKLHPEVKFIIEMIDKQTRGFFYKDHKTSGWFAEENLELSKPDPQPITTSDFNRVWHAHYGCTWDNSKSHDLYVNLKNYLEQRGLVI